MYLKILGDKNYRMKKYLIYIKHTGLLVTIFFLLSVGMKFLFFSFSSSLLQYCNFIKFFNNMSDEIRTQIFFNYPKVVALMNIGSVIIFVVSFIVVLVIAKMRRVSGVSFLFFIILVIFIWLFDLLKLNSFKFYDIIPMRLFSAERVQLYFILNSLLFLGSCFFVFFILKKDTAGNVSQ